MYFSKYRFQLPSSADFTLSSNGHLDLKFKLFMPRRVLFFAWHGVMFRLNKLWVSKWVESLNSLVVRIPGLELLNWKIWCFDRRNSLGSRKNSCKILSSQPILPRVQEYMLMCLSSNWPEYSFGSGLVHLYVENAFSCAQMHYHIHSWCAQPQEI